MFRIYSRFDSGVLCEWHECTGCTQLIGAGDQQAVRFWLSGFLLDDSQHSRLRHVAHAAGDGLGLGLLHGQRLVDRLAHEIGSGRLRICANVHVYPQDHANVDSTGVAPPSVAPPPVSRTRSAPVAPPPPEPTTLPRNIDAAAMAGVLTAAAADGVPFCEICEKRKREREQAAEATA